MVISPHALPLLTPISAEDIVDLDIHLPTLKVLSFSGPGQTGGVATSLEPIVKRLGTKVHWFSIENQSSDVEPIPFDQVRNFSPSINSGFAFYSTSIPKRLIDGHKRFSANYLWPLLHGMREHALFDAEDWKNYKMLCSRVASECQSVLSESFPTLCWLHDYQLAMCAPLISSERGTIACQFWHVPWPEVAIMQHEPVTKELVESLLCNRLIGFHTAEYAHNFLQTVEALCDAAQVDSLKMTVSFKGQKTQIVVMPLGIDVSKWHKLAKTSRPMAEALPVKHRLANQILLGIDRLDYTKGVLEKLSGLEHYLENAKDMHRRFHYVQISQPAQSNEPSFSEYSKKVEAKIQELNEKYEQDGWRPILHIQAQLNQKELAAWYQAADVMTVNSVRDGLNLIAKEYVACRQDEQGTLILSDRAGCAAELGQGALLVSPTSPSEFSDALAKALSMGIEEKRRRMTSMRHVIGWNQLHDWALGFLRQALT
ncbi:trehalose-6-phosphate synthase [Candidatus Obscuribacterales bacterium]|nr:trehalose-6-phosphate synthase [Candidatus Obscuribacterales bacterium]MBX3150553.1 trehalose-6-phosphate synthase [Candidatus Obscuribacterales bacterium]